MVLADKEIDPIRKELNKHMEDVKKLACKLVYWINFKNRIKPDIERRIRLDSWTVWNQIYSVYIAKDRIW